MICILKLLFFINIHIKMFAKLSIPVPEKLPNEEINKNEDSQNFGPQNNNPIEKNTQNVSKHIKNNIKNIIFLILVRT